MGVNSLPKTVTRQRGDCDLNPGPSAPESSTLTTRLPSHPHITPCYTHKMAIVIVTTDYVTSFHPIYSNAAVSTGVGELGFSWVYALWTCLNERGGAADRSDTVDGSIARARLTAGSMNKALGRTGGRVGGEWSRTNKQGVCESRITHVSSQPTDGSHIMPAIIDSRSLHKRTADTSY